MAEKTAVELALNSISWQLKRIADSLETEPKASLPWNRAIQEMVWYNNEDGEVYLRGKLLKEVLKERQ